MNFRWVTNIHLVTRLYLMLNVVCHSRVPQIRASLCQTRSLSTTTMPRGTRKGRKPNVAGLQVHFPTTSWLTLRDILTVIRTNSRDTMGWTTTTKTSRYGSTPASTSYATNMRSGLSQTRRGIGKRYVCYNIYEKGFAINVRSSPSSNFFLIGRRNWRTVGRPVVTRFPLASSTTLFFNSN